MKREDYDRILERVYFSVASQVYTQLKTDVQRKIDLLPTTYLRANAYFQEAEDYAASNTVDAYLSARDLYQKSADLLTGASSRPAAHWSELPGRWMELAGRHLRQQRQGFYVGLCAGAEGNEERPKQQRSPPRRKKPTPRSPSAHVPPCQGGGKAEPAHAAALT